MDFSKLILSFEIGNIDWHQFALSDWYGISGEQNGKAGVYVKYKHIANPVLDRIIRLADMNTVAYFICTTEAYKAGLKCIEPNFDQCMAFENIEPNVPMAQYNQPYPTVIVEFPQEYKASFQSRYNVRPPICAITHWKPEIPMMVMIVFFGDKYPVVAFYISPGGKDKTIESSMRYIMDQEKELRERDPDYKIADNVLRMSINLNLYMVNFGFDKQGYKNVKQHRFLERKKPMEAKKDIYYIGLKQNIKLYRREKYHPSAEPGTHASPKPHWRRGHYRNQHFGIGNSQIKLVMIPPVFVCAESFKGDLSTTSVEYKG